MTATGWWRIFPQSKSSGDPIQDARSRLIKTGIVVGHRDPFTTLTPRGVTLAGKLIFGFLSKRQMGAKVRTGNTQCQSKTGNLNFSSTAYQWLVVSGTKAQCKGEGAINGSGSYGFLLTATPDDVGTAACLEPIS